MKINNRQQFLIVLTIAALALLIGNSLIFEPLIKLWKARADKITDLRHQVKDGKFLIQHEADTRGRWNQMQTNMLPNNTSLAEAQVFKSFDNWASASGAGITEITPQWKNDSDDYMTLNCRVEASGTLGTLSQFLYDIEKDPVALRINSVELGARDNTGQQLTLGLEISGLVLTHSKQ